MTNNDRFYELFGETTEVIKDPKWQEAEYEERDRDIYLVMTMKHFEEGEGCVAIRGFRVVGWFSTKEDAEGVVIRNACDIYEGDYTYAMVERSREGATRSKTPSSEIYFYKINEETEKYEIMETPEFIWRNKEWPVAF